MFTTPSAAYAHGQETALEDFGLTKSAGIGGQIAGLAGKALKWGGRAAGTVPMLGTAANAVIGGAGGLVTGLANQGMNAKGLTEGLARAGTNIATGSIPGGGGIVAGLAGDMAMDKMFAPKPQAGPAQAPMPGAMGQARLPGMVQ